MVSLYNFPLYSFPNKRLNLSIWLFDTLSSIKLCSHLFALYFSADLSTLTSKIQHFGVVAMLDLVFRLWLQSPVGPIEWAGMHQLTL